MQRGGLIILLLVGFFGSAMAASAPGELTIRGTISTAAWEAFCNRFVDPSGRVIDDANGNISHSEGQGYGLILALAADDPAGFERIWSFTQTELLIRDDGLAVWSWRLALPHVTDINNASDGDLLIAYALAKAGESWSITRYTDAATRLATALAKSALVKDGDLTLLLPGMEGFTRDSRPDGPVVNLSYWIFEALPTLAKLAPDGNWGGLSRTGLALIAASRFGPLNLPTDWVSLRESKPQPAADFDPEFGYNAIRIPLYLIRAGISDPRWLAPFAKAWQSGETAGLSLINVKTNQVTAQLTDPGYRMMAAVVDCVTGGTPIPADLKLFAPTHYFPSTLYLLSVSYLSERQPQCL